MTPPDGGECTEKLFTKKIQGVYSFDFVKIGHSKEAYCAGGPENINWYGYANIGGKVLYIEIGTDDISATNIIDIEASILTVITSIKYL